MAGSVSFGGGGTGYYGQAWAGRNGRESYLRGYAGGYPTGNLNSDGNRPVSIDSISITGASGFSRYTLSTDGYMYLYFGPNVRVTINTYKNNNSHLYDSWSNSYFYMQEYPYSPIGIDGSYTWSTVPTKVTNLNIGRSNDGATLTGSFNGPTDNGGRSVDYYRVYTSENDGAWVHRGDGYQNGQISLSVTKTSTYRILVYAHNSLGFSESVTSSYSYGAPAKPAKPTATRSDSVSGRISVSWTAPSSSLAITEYAVDRYSSDGQTFLARIYSGGTDLSVNDSGLPRGDEYTYRVYAKNSTGWSDISDASGKVMAPGVPAIPAGEVSLTKVGRNVTVSCGQSPNNYGNIIIGYAVQYSTDDGETWSGGTAMTNRSYQYVLLPPALTYIFRCYAINSIGNGDTVESDPIFVSAGGRRKLPNGGFEPTQTAKRYDSSRPEGQKWVDLNTAKRYSAALDQWVDLS